MDTEMPEGPCDDFSATPVDALLRDPNWKPRKAGYDKLKTLLESAGASLTEVEGYLAMLPAFVEETNVATFEAALEAALALLTVAGKFEAPKSIATAVAERGLVGRVPGARQLWAQVQLAVLCQLRFRARGERGQ